MGELESAVYYLRKSLKHAKAAVRALEDVYDDTRERDVLDVKVKLDQVVSLLDDVIKDVEYLIEEL